MFAAISQKEDLLNCNYGEGVDVITDKGTLDAIGLSDNPDGRYFKMLVLC